MRTAFSYYGGKGMIVSRYPAPIYDTIVEPFAGGAPYSLKHHRGRRIILGDANTDTCSVWRFLQSESAVAWATKIPERVSRGDTIDSIICGMGGDAVPIGLRWMLRFAANVGLGGTGKNSNTITVFAANSWYRNTVKKIKYWHNRIRHWEINNTDYENMPDIEATWFVDPPYSNAAGLLYKYSDLEYNQLRDWIMSRRGQVIVCGNVSETWLDFKPLAPPQGTRAAHISERRSPEGMWSRINKKN